MVMVAAGMQEFLVGQVAATLSTSGINQVLQVLPDKAIAVEALMQLAQLIHKEIGVVVAIGRAVVVVALVDLQQVGNHLWQMDTPGGLIGRLMRV